MITYIVSYVPGPFPVVSKVLHSHSELFGHGFKSSTSSSLPWTAEAEEYPKPPATIIPPLLRRTELWAYLHMTIMESHGIVGTIINTSMQGTKLSETS